VTDVVRVSVPLVPVPVKPPDGVTVTVYEVDAPWMTVCDEGEAESEKSDRWDRRSW
jgi:hypothetical protein